MLTPQEVSEHAFSRASFGGYNMAQVDEFLDVLTGDYTSLYSENAVLKSKMKVLVDKVEEYRSTEEAMRKALMAAQRMAKDLVKEAEDKKSEILQQAEEESQKRIGELSQELAAEKYRLGQAQQATADYVKKVLALQNAQRTFLDKLQEISPEPPAQPDEVDKTVSEIDDNVQRLLQQAMVDATAENLQSDGQTQEQEPEPEQDLSDTAEFAPVSTAAASHGQEETSADPVSQQGSRIDFGDLQFGRDYEIT